MMGLRREIISPDMSLDLAPVLAIPLILMVFFLVRLGFSAEAQVAVSPASTGKALVIGVSGAGTVNLEGKRLDLSSLRASVSRMLLASPGVRVMVVSDETARALLITRVIEECRLAGASEIGLATRSEGARHER